MELTLGPLLFNWPPDAVEAFYGRIADETPVSRVYLGEVVCSKRLPFLEPTLVRAAERLEAAGKTVVWSTLALPATEREQALTAALAGLESEIEINDMSGLAMRAGRPFVAGPHLNIYNAAALHELVRLGCRRLVANIELSLESLAGIHKALPAVPVELTAFGRIPLAISGRCYHARAEGLHKDSCQFVCDRDADGRTVKTVEGADFLTINGVQTLSYAVQVAAVPTETLRKCGVSALRLSPHSLDMVAVIAAFDAFRAGRIDVADLTARLGTFGLPGPLVAGYPNGHPGHRALRQEA